MSRKKKIVVAVIAATVLGIATVGCAETPSEKSAEAAYPKAAKSDQKRSAAETAEEAKKRSKAVEEAKKQSQAAEAREVGESGPNEETRELMRYLDENFGPSSPVGQTSWYASITGVDCCSAWDGRAQIDTTTFDSSVAEGICLAVVLSGQVAGANVWNPEAGKIAECG